MLDPNDVSDQNPDLDPTQGDGDDVEAVGEVLDKPHDIVQPSTNQPPGPHGK